MVGWWNIFNLDYKSAFVKLVSSIDSRKIYNFEVSEGWTIHEFWSNIRTNDFKDILSQMNFARTWKSIGTYLLLFWIIFLKNWIFFKINPHIFWKLGSFWNSHYKMFLKKSTVIRNLNF